MANKFGSTYSSDSVEAPLSPRIFAILNNTYKEEKPTMPLLGESIIHKRDKEQALERKRAREEKEAEKAEKKARAKAHKQIKSMLQMAQV